MKRNGLIFTLGVTNSGKTHTMMGTGPNPGVVPRCLQALFTALRTTLAPRGTFAIDDASRIPYVEVMTSFFELHAVFEPLQDPDAAAPVRTRGKDSKRLSDVVRGNSAAYYQQLIQGLARMPRTTTSLTWTACLPIRCSCPTLRSTTRRSSTSAAHQV